MKKVLTLLLLSSLAAPALADDRLYRVGAAYESARGPIA